MHISHMCSHSGQKARPLPLVADSVTDIYSSCVRTTDIYTIKLFHFQLHSLLMMIVLMIADCSEEGRAFQGRFV